MQIIKEVRLERTRPNPNDPEKPSWFDHAIGVVRTRSYGSNLDYIAKLFAAAKADYPTLIEAQCKVVHYGGDRYSGTFGIEFQIPEGEGASAKPGWTEIRELEKTR